MSLTDASEELPEYTRFTLNQDGTIQTVNNDRRSVKRLQKALPLAAGVVTAYLLWRRLNDRRTERTDYGRIKSTDDVTQKSSPDEVVPEYPAIPAGVSESDIERAVDTLSAPTNRGMPVLGIGTHHHAGYDECFETIQEALQIGYRHIDTTVQREAYYNESAVGDAVTDADVPREDIFVATKVAPADLDPKHVRISIKESLDRLGMEYVDLLYPQWSPGEYEVDETLNVFADLREEGLIREIGVSNFTIDLLKEALEVIDAPIFANQVEMHPLLPQEGLREFCARDDVDVELVAYSPLARGDVKEVTALQEVAAKHGATPEQISLAWLREKGVTAIPRATSTEHLQENWLSLGVELDDEDMATLDSIEERRRIVDDDTPWNR